MLVQNPKRTLLLVSETQARKESITYLISSLKQCSKTRDFERGKSLHIHARNCGVHTNKFVAAALVTMYSKCGSLVHARLAFDSIIATSGHADVVLWNNLLLAYVNNGETLIALDIFTTNIMNQLADPVTFMAGLKACTGLTSRLDKLFCLSKAITIHKQAKEFGYESDVILATSLINMYSKCGSVLHARQVFSRLNHRNVVAWASHILGHAQNGESLTALELYSDLSDELKNSVTFIAALRACVDMTKRQLDRHFCLEKGVEIHKEVLHRRLENDMFLSSSLLGMYTSCGSMIHARKVFDRMARRDIVSWTNLLQGYVKNGESLLALEVFECMKDCEPTAVTIVPAIKACGGLVSQLDKRFCLERGVGIHRRARAAGFDSDSFVASTLVELYSKCGSFLHMRAVFDSMLRREVVSWTSVILGYVENGKSLIAVDLFHSMDCSPNSVTFIAALKAYGSLALEKVLERMFCLERNVELHRRAQMLGFAADLSLSNNLIYTYGHCGSMLHARSVFDGLIHRDVITWNYLLLGYVGNGEHTAALECFTTMDLDPNAVTFVAVLKACGEASAMSIGESIHAQVRKSGAEDNPLVATCLVDFYGKCGAMDAAEGVFESMNSRDVVAWNAFIAGYSSLGKTSKVFGVLKRMQDSGLEMDGVTVLLALTACSHAGMVDQGRNYFESMPGLGVSPCMEHYACMVDMLGRANILQEALDLIKDMPFQPSRVVWKILLSACTSWNNLEIGKVAFTALYNFQIKPNCRQINQRFKI